MLGANDQDDSEEDREIVVAILTTDFAMQNVMKQIGIHVLSAEGVIIKETKTWILRCYACFKTTPHMDKQFCPNCGNKTLKKVSIHVIGRRKLDLEKASQFLYTVILGHLCSWKELWVKEFTYSENFSKN